MTKSGQTRLICLRLAAGILVTTGSCAESPPTPQEIRQEAAKDVIETIQETVKDPQRETELLQMAKVLERETEALLAVRNTFQLRVAKSSADYDMDSDSLRTLIEEYEAAVAPGRDRIVETLLVMRQRATRDEWEKIGNQLADNLKTRFREI